MKTVQNGICHGLLILDDTVYDVFIRHLCNAAIICTIAVTLLLGIYFQVIPLTRFCFLCFKLDLTVYWEGLRQQRKTKGRL